MLLHRCDWYRAFKGTAKRNGGGGSKEERSNAIKP